MAQRSLVECTWWPRSSGETKSDFGRVSWTYCDHSRNQIGLLQTKKRKKNTPDFNVRSTVDELHVSNSDDLN